MYVVQMVPDDNGQPVTRFIGKNPESVFSDTERGEKKALLFLLSVAFGAAAGGQLLMLDPEAAAQKFIRFFVFDSNAAMVQGHVAAIIQLKTGKPTTEELEPIKAVEVPLEEIPMVQLDKSQVRTHKLIVPDDYKN